MIRFVLQVVFLALVFAAAWRVGGKPERYMASIYSSMLFAALLGAILLDDIGAGLPPSQNYRFLLDIAALVAVATVAVLYDRWWTLWVGSVQLIAVTAHVLKLTGLAIHPLVYGVMERWPTWVAIALTGLGTWLHCRRSSRTALDT
jgi:hypothetical protein